MKQKKYVNVIIVLAVSAILLFVWFKGVDYAYAKLLQIGANICLAFSPDTSIGLRLTDDNPTFIVKTVIDGKKGVFPQKANLILLPFIMILTWQILLLFNIDRKKALRSAAENLIAFYIVQVIYLLLLTGYYKSGTVKFMYDLLLDSFYIIILFLIVKDAFKFGLIHLNRKEEDKKEGL